jgi:multidrug efflux pump subunit AcrA (membrane-fusion protein)
MLAGGAGTTFWLIRSRPEPVRHGQGRNVPQVAVLPVVPQTFAAPIIGHGTVRPKVQVHIVPQLTGRLTYVHPDLAEGQFVKKGELLFEIDPRTYESQVRQVEADVRRLEAQLARLPDEKSAGEQRLELARAQLKIADDNVERWKGLLHEQAGATKVQLEQAELEQLRAKDAVIDLENKVSLYPYMVAEAQAALDGRRAALEEAQNNVERTRIFAPFNARIDAITAQASQVVVPAFQIATLTDMDAFEIATVLDPRDLQWTEHRAYARILGHEAPPPPDVRVTWTMFGQSLAWHGQVTRLERHDEATRTARVVVEVANLEFDQSPDDGPPRPSLSIGMFCRAEIPAEPLKEALVIPRHAMHDDHTVLVFVPDDVDASSAGHLEIRHVPMLRTVGDDVLVAFRGDEERVVATQVADSAAVNEQPAVCELRPNDLLIVSPLPRPVPGMRLDSRPALAARHAPAEGGWRSMLAVADRAWQRAASYLPEPGVPRTVLTRVERAALPPQR